MPTTEEEKRARFYAAVDKVSAYIALPNSLGAEDTWDMVMVDGWLTISELETIIAALKEIQSGA